MQTFLFLAFEFSFFFFVVRCSRFRLVGGFVCRALSILPIRLSFFFLRQDRKIILLWPACRNSSWRKGFQVVLVCWKCSKANSKSSSIFLVDRPFSFQKKVLQTRQFLEFFVVPFRSPQRAFVCEFFSPSSQLCEFHGDQEAEVFLHS